MINKEFKIEGMSCGHCVKAVEIELSELDLAKTEVDIGSVKVEFDETTVDEKQIISAIEEAGFKVI